MNWEEIKLEAIRDQAKKAREFFETHDATISEVMDRHRLGEIEFLLSIIDKLSRRPK